MSEDLQDQTWQTTTARAGHLLTCGYSPSLQTPLWSAYFEVSPHVKNS